MAISLQEKNFNQITTQELPKTLEKTGDIMTGDLKINFTPTAIMGVISKTYLLNLWGQL